MNTAGLNVIKTLGALTAVTFFTVYNTYDSYNYNYHQVLAFLTFISTTATPLFFVVTGYMDAGSETSAKWQINKIRSILTIFLFWFSIYFLWEPYQKGYFIQPWFVFSLVIIYAFQPSVEWLVQHRALFGIIIFSLLLFSYLYDLLALHYPASVWFAVPPQFRIWTWLLYYFTGRLLYDPVITALYSRPKVTRIALYSIPFVYTFTWFYEKHFFFSLFQIDRNSFVLTGSQVYILVLMIIIAAKGANKEVYHPTISKVLAPIGKTMTGVYILHYSFFSLLTRWFPITSLPSKLVIILFTFLLSVLFSMLLLKNRLTKLLITF